MRGLDGTPGRPVGLPLEGLARLVGHYVWLERRLFEVLGGWVPSTADPRAKLAFQAHAGHHAWHAELWMERCPRLPHLEPRALVVAPDPGLADLFDRLAHCPDLAQRLASAYEMLVPQLIDSYSLHLQRASRVSEGPVVRALELVLADERRDGAEGRSLLGALVGTAKGQAAARDVRADLAGWLSRRSSDLAWDPVGPVPTS